MDYKAKPPIPGNDPKDNIERVLGYIEDLKSETEARLTFMENIIKKMMPDDYKREVIS